MIILNQTSARIVLTTGIDFAAVVFGSQFIKFRKPDGTESQWTAAILSGSESDGKIFVDFDDTVKFDQVGRWHLWSYLIFDDTRIAQGKTAYTKIYKEGF